jgi:hypothetical protein
MPSQDAFLKDTANRAATREQDAKVHTTPANCTLCRFWQPVYSRERGICRVNAPILGQGYQEEGIGRWPTTLGGDWCGQGEARSR